MPDAYQWVMKARLYHRHNTRATKQRQQPRHRQSPFLFTSPAMLMILSPVHTHPIETHAPNEWKNHCASSTNKAVIDSRTTNAAALAHCPALTYSTVQPSKPSQQPLRSIDRSMTVCVCLRSLATDAARQLDVLGHDGDSLGVYGAEVGVLEQRHEVGLGRLLQCADGRRLEAPEYSVGDRTQTANSG